MLKDFEMIAHRFPEREDIKLYAIGDLHLSAQECMEKAWESFLNRVCEEKNSYVGIVGDMLNNGIKTSLTNVYEERYRPRMAKEMLTKHLKPIRDKILFGTGGNHERRNKDVDNDILYDVFAKLDIEDLYRENMTFTKIQIGDISGAGEKNPTYMIVATHGAGSSIYTGAASTRAERFGQAIDGADMLIVGHIHKPSDIPEAKIRIDKQNNRVKVMPWRLVACTSWLSYAPYATQKLYTPTAFVEQEIILRGTKKEIEVRQKTGH